MIGRSHKWAAGNLIKPEGFGKFLKRIKLGRMHKSLNLQVVFAGLEVLPQGNHVYPMRLEISQHLLHFIQGLAQAQHQSGLGHHSRTSLLIGL